MTKYTRTERAKDAEIYRRAARLFERREFELGSCLAIAQVAKLPFGYDDNHPLIANYYELFGDGFASWAFEDHNYDERCLALCFMAAITEAGDV